MTTPSYTPFEASSDAYESNLAHQIATDEARAEWVANGEDPDNDDGRDWEDDGDSRWAR